MDRRLTRAVLAASGTALLVFCSSSTSPGVPTVASTWHMTVGALGLGTLTPSSFDVVITQNGAGYNVSVPTLVWSVGPDTINGSASVYAFPDTTIFGFIKRAATGCALAEFAGHLNASKTALTGAEVDVGDSVATVGGSPTCFTQTTGSLTATK